MKKLIHSLLAFCLLLSALPAAAAAGGPSVTYTPNGSTAATFSVEDLDGRVYGAQLELELDGEYPQTKFTPSDSSAYAPECQVTVSGQTTTVRIYLVPSSNKPLGENGWAELGTLDIGGRLTLPGKVHLTLLDRDLQPYEGANSAELPLRRAGSSSNPGNSGSSGSSGSSGGSSNQGTYRVSVDGADHGKVEVRPTRAERGDTVTITVTPDRGYVLDRLVVVDGDGERLELRDRGGGTYTFTMPRGGVEVRASFVLDEEEPPTGPSQEDWGPLPFTDVQERDWFWESVAYVYHEGLMNGTGAGRFSPGETTTRGMIVTILYRLEGSPAASLSRFRDVEEGKYYSSAVAWASVNGVVEGYSDGRFGPDDPITREQLAVILFRYAGYKGYSTSARANLSSHGDAHEIASYAQEAMQWARAEGLINGTDTGALLPGGKASRAEIAAILMRFCENIADAQ